MHFLYGILLERAIKCNLFLNKKERNLLRKREIQIINYYFINQT